MARTVSSGPGSEDVATIEGFGFEWSGFPQNRISEAEKRTTFDAYFAIWPTRDLSLQSVGADLGCGSGRWATLVAPTVGRLHLVDASRDALAVARENLKGVDNVEFHECCLDELPFPDESLDFAYSLGVLHHLSNMEAALAEIVSKLKPGAPLLLYLYYAFDNRTAWYRLLWKVTDAMRRLISRCPAGVKSVLAEVIALTIYVPLVTLGRALDLLGILPEHWPLRSHIGRSVYVMRTDALDRFGTRTEKRFSKGQIENMLERAGLRDIKFSQAAPYWCVVSFRSRDVRA